MASLSPSPGAHRGFTLIELLVVIAIIALLVGILLPALGKARASARAAACLSNTRQMGLSMTQYANEWKDWYPIIPISDTYRANMSRVPDPYLDGQATSGGVASLFSLTQRGDTDAPGFVSSRTPPAYNQGNPTRSLLVENPLLAGSIEGYGILYCPNDREDRYYGPVTNPSSANYAAAPVKIPHIPKDIEDVVSYNISYLYIAGLKTDEPVVLKPAPIWGDETNGPDVSTAAWYANAAQATAAGTRPGYYGPGDNHGKEGGNFVFTDGHADLVKGNVQATFFSDARTSGQSINVVKPRRSDMVQTID